MEDKDMSPMMRAFVEQSNLDADGADLRDASLLEWQEQQYKKALKQMMKVESIVKMTFPNDKIEVHPLLKEYDHSLEKDRLFELNIKKGLPVIDDHESMRPVEKDGVIEYVTVESNLTIDELLDRT